MIYLLTKLFPLWAVIFSIVAYFYPFFFANFRAAIIPLLTIVMFGMGMTLKWSNFREVFQTPGLIFLGVLLQYTIMPFTAFLISFLFNLSPALTSGMVLVGSSSGGTASNVICYLAGGNVALSITMTMISTLMAVFMTPLLSLLYLNQIVSVPFLKILLSILQMVFIPVVLGTTVNTLIGSKIKRFSTIFPFLSTLAIIIIIAIIVGLNQQKLSEIGLVVIVSVALHNSGGLVIGYWFPKLLGYDRQISRTLCIEVGMQNSGLSVALAVKYFSINAALPGAVFSIWHNLSGSILAGYWRLRRVE